MKFNDILMAIDNNTKIRLAVRLYGMKFITDYHYREYCCSFLERSVRLWQ